MYPSDEEIELVYKRFNCNKKENEKEVKMFDFIIELTTTPAPKKIEKLSEMLQAIEDQMNIEKQIEKWKEDLLKMKNYKFDELYRLFDVNESNSISPQEFREAITNTLEVKKLKDEDIFMLYQNYNENGDGKLRFFNKLNIIHIK